jgi:hypothetical protein
LFLGFSRKSSSKVLFQDVRPWLLVVILCLSTFNIDDEFNFGTIVRVNAAKLLDAYALQFFHGEIDSEALRKAREPLFKEIVGAVIAEDYAKKHLIIQRTLDWSDRSRRRNLSNIRPGRRQFSLNGPNTSMA